MKMKKSKRHPFLNAPFGDKIYLIFVAVISVFAFFITLYPFIYVVSVSMSGSHAVYKGEVMLWPVDINFSGYKQVIKQEGLWGSYLNTLYYTGFGTLLNMIATTIAAYPLSRQRFFARRFFNFALAFTMYFGGGLIPTYVMITNLGLYNSRWVMLLPGLVSAYNTMICRSAFAAIPNELMESAEIDGANDLKIFTHIAIRLIHSTLAVLTLYYAVGHWNNFFTPMIYFSKDELMPVQVLLRRVLIQSSDEMVDAASVGASDMAAVTVQIRYVTIVVATLPILAIYPFLQKYFVKGVMIGAVKG